MIADYIEKINEYLKPDDDYGSSHVDNYGDVDLEYNLKKSAEYLQTLKKNCQKVYGNLILDRENYCIKRQV